MKPPTITKLLSSAVAVVALSFGASAFASNIATVEGYANNSAASIEGIVTAVWSVPGANNGYAGSAYYAVSVQDASGSLVSRCYRSRDDRCRLRFSHGGGRHLPYGQLFLYHNIPELGNSAANNLHITLNSSGNTQPPQIVTIAQVNNVPLLQSIEGYYVEIQNVTLGGTIPATFPTTGNAPSASPFWTVSDATGTAVLYWWPTSYSLDAQMAGTTVPTGTLDVEGFASIYPGNTFVEFTPLAFQQVPEPTTGLWLLGGCSLLAWNVIRRRK